MALAASNMSEHIQKQLTRSLERILEEAYQSGELKLSGRKLKDFPKLSKSSSTKYSLQDTVLADLSKNRFQELPEEVTEFQFLEKLHLYHNAIRVIPETVSMLHSLSYLDLSRNQLTTLPREICRLPLQTLLVAHNRLVTLPEELSRMSVLAELDAGCNDITSLPTRIGDLPRLRVLDLRSNLLVHIPIELTYLKLLKLDVSGNRISVLPNELRKMKCLVDLKLSENPLCSPPAVLCNRGRTHIFKYLEQQAARHERDRGCRAWRGDSLETATNRPGHVATLDSLSHDNHHRRGPINSGYSTSDAIDKRRSQNLNGMIQHDGDVRDARCNDCSPLLITLPRDSGINGSFSGTSTPSTISPGENNSLEDELAKAIIHQDQLNKRRLERSTSENGADVWKPSFAAHQTSLTPTGQLEASLVGPMQQNSLSQPMQFIQTTNSLPLVNGDEKRSLSHIQTYREYKEALRQQRTGEGQNVYRPKEQTIPPSKESHDTADSSVISVLSNKQIFNEDNANKRPVQKVTPSRISYQNNAFDSPNKSECNLKNEKFHEQNYKKPSSPVKTSSSILSGNASPAYIPRSVRKATDNAEGNKSPSRNGTSPNSSRSVTWNANLPEKYSFTMRREYERAKEEADLIEQLRNHIETKLKMALPEDMAPALTDGVVLCHLANYVKPRSVASIHVPSPAVPKLTMARCRRNVDNFLEACRKIGVDEEALLDTDAIMDVGYMSAYGLEALGRLVSMLILNIEESRTGELRRTDYSALTNQDYVLSNVLLIAFISTLMLLYLFPIPD